MSVKDHLINTVVRRIGDVEAAGVIDEPTATKVVDRVKGLRQWEEWEEDRLRRWEALVPVLNASRDDQPSCSTCQVEMELRVGKYGPFWGCPNHRKTGCRISMSVPKHAAVLYHDPMADRDGYFLTADQLEGLRRDWLPRYSELRRQADSHGYVYDHALLTQAVASVEQGKITDAMGSALMSGVRKFEREVSDWIESAKKREVEAVLKRRKRSARFAGMIRGRE